MNVTVDIQTASAEPVPDEDDIRGWVRAALEGRISGNEAEVSMRLVDEPEMTELNKTYRKKSCSTNVLSFPAGEVEGLPADVPRLLGDIVICAEVVRTEAAEQGKDVADHWAHMLVHGTLHLLGHDHETDAEAVEMEALEARILSHFGVPDPYGETGDN